MSLRSRDLMALRRTQQIWSLRFLMVAMVLLTAIINLDWKEPTITRATIKIDAVAVLAEMKARSSTVLPNEWFDDVSSQHNAWAVREQRAQLEMLCRHGDKYDFAQGLTAMFQPPKIPVESPNTSTIQPCQKVFWDLGVNIGDTVYKFINAGFYHLPCPTSFHLDEGHLVQNYVSSIDPEPSRWAWFLNGKGTNGAHWDGIDDWVNSRMREASQMSRPEDYCYFGVEGNPALTDRLQKLAARTMQTSPRPLRSLAFLTETVITDHDGSVEMFLEGEAGQGSSILVEKSKRSRHQQGKAIVRGITLATLLEETVLMTDDSHLMIKMDVEGAEYAILNQDWETLCHAVEVHHLNISLLLELHGQRKIGKNNDLTAFHRNHIIQKLVNCGVHIVMDSMRFPGMGRVYRSVTK